MKQRDEVIFSQALSALAGSGTRILNYVGSKVTPADVREVKASLETMTREGGQLLPVFGMTKREAQRRLRTAEAR